MKNIDADELARLKQIALAATPGPWLDGNWFSLCPLNHKHASLNRADPCHYTAHFSEGGRLVSAGNEQNPLTIIGNNEETGVVMKPADKAHIVAFNPAVVLQLISLINAQDEENARLRKTLGERLVSETMIQDLSVSNGGLNISLEGGGARLLAASFADQFRQSGAVNYLEMGFTSGDLNLIVTLQKQDGKTPAQFRKEAEDKTAEVEEMLRTFVQKWESGEDMTDILDKAAGHLGIQLSGD